MSEDKAEYKYVRPLPCVLDEHGVISGQTVKQLLAKIDEELNELKWELGLHPVNSTACEFAEHLSQVERITIAEEAADTITAITTMLAALGIYAKIRNDAQERVNQKNFERARL